VVTGATTRYTFGTEKFSPQKELNPIDIDYQLIVKTYAKLQSPWHSLEGVYNVNNCQACHLKGCIG
jgi:hypothetical protein